MGAIKPSQSAWASPILCVPKKTGEVRVCCDYRVLNGITRVPATPIPRVQDLLQHMGGKKYYHAFDLAHGYHNLEIHEEDQPKTAIILPEDLGLPNRHYEFTRLSFGLSAAPGAFQYVTDRLVTPAKDKNPQNDLGPHVSVYLDDICIAGADIPSMFQRLEALLNRVRAAEFLLKAKKCELFQTEVSYLGHLLSEQGIKTDGIKIEKIIHWPRPQCQKELRSWLGIVTYYSKYLHHMATTAYPLYKLLRADTPYEWTEECEKAFQTLKEQLTTPPILGSPDVTKGPFTLTCDASLTGLGAVLTQEQDGVDVTIAYWSKALNRSQMNYCTTHRELLALVESVKAFNHYLAGAPFKVRSDHAALQWLKTFKNPTGKLARWLERLAPYQFQVVYTKGTNIGNADALSRRPNRPCSITCKTCEKLEDKEKQQMDLQINRNMLVPNNEIQILSWNVSSIRSIVRNNKWQAIVDKNPDLICLQETRCSSKIMPIEVKESGFPYVFWSPDDDPLHYSGVAVLSKAKPEKVHFGTTEGYYKNRLITLFYEDFVLVNTYVPYSGENLANMGKRQEWDRELRKYLEKLSEIYPLIVCGDFNVAAHDIDVHKAERNSSTAGFTERERNNFQKLLRKAQLKDTYREQQPLEIKYTCWQRGQQRRENNIGWRLDYTLANRKAFEMTIKSGMHTEVQGSDHCPTYITICTSEDYQNKRVETCSHIKTCVQTCNICRKWTLKEMEPNEKTIPVHWTSIVPEGVEPEQMTKDQLT